MSIPGHSALVWAEVSADAPAAERASYPQGPIKPGGAVPRLMRDYSNLWADLSARSGYNALTRDPPFGMEFLDEFQDRLMFGIDSCLRSDVNSVHKNVACLRYLREKKELPDSTMEKIKWKNCAKVVGLGHSQTIDDIRDKCF